MMQSVALSVERRMARRLMNSELKGSERKGPGISLRYYSVASEGTEENLRTYKAIRVPSYRVQVTTAEFPKPTQSGRCAGREFRFVIRHN